MLFIFYTMDFDSYLNRTNTSVNELAEKLGVKPAAIYNYKYGKSKPSYDVLEKMFLNGATIKEMFNEEVEAKIISYLQVSQSSSLSEAEIVRKGLLELAKHLQG